MKIWTDATTLENWKIFENFESISSKCQFISIHKNVDIKILADGKILKSLKIFEKLETYIPAFESV